MIFNYYGRRPTIIGNEHREGLEAHVDKIHEENDNLTQEISESYKPMSKEDLQEHYEIFSRPYKAKIINDAFLGDKND